MSGEISLDRLLANYRLAVQIQDRDGSRENHKAVADAHRALHAAWNRRAEPSAQGESWPEVQAFKNLCAHMGLKESYVRAQLKSGEMVLSPVVIDWAERKPLAEPSAQGQAVEWTDAPVSKQGLYWVSYCDMVEPRWFWADGEKPPLGKRSVNPIAPPPPPAAPQPAEPAAEGVE